MPRVTKVYLDDLTPKEKLVIAALRKLEKLMHGEELLLQAGTGGVNLMRTVNGQVPIVGARQWDQDYTVANIAIRADGGDPW